MKRIRNLTRSVFALCLAMLLALAPIGASAVSAWINVSGVTIYSTTGKKGTLPKGTTVNFTDWNGHWAKINYRGVTGITLLRNITLKSGLTGYARVNTPLYKYASTSSASYGTIPKGTTLKVVGINGSFYQVTNTSYSICGYVLGSNVSKTRPAASKPSSSSASKPAATKNYTKAEKVAILANSLQGRPYAYGAEGSQKFDCSGFTYYVYKNAAGVTLKRSSYEQGNDSRFGTVASISGLRQGDMVCFNTSGGSVVDHVGVYIGGNKFIHASSTAGKVVVSEIDTAYYKSAFKWGKRIV